MSDILDYIENNPKQTKRLLGLNYEQLQQLITQAELLHNQKQAEIERAKTRLIAKGGGRRAKLSSSDEIVLTLVYLRHFPTFQLLGIQFGISESTANDIFKYWSVLVGELLPPSLLEQVKKSESDYEVVRELLTELELIVDSAEQARERPRDYQEQKKFYSGKKKSHTLKNQFVVLPDGGDIVDVTAGKAEKISDINLWREVINKFAPNQKFGGDKAYLGEPQIATPHKKPRKSELTEAQKKENKEFSGQRIFVEHVIRLVKIFRVAQERFRLRPETYEQVVFTVCGLVRLRIGALILPA